MTHTNDPRRIPLADATAAAHDRSRAALTSAHRVMDGVIQLSAHLTAMEHVVYPLLSTLLPGDREMLAEQRRLAGRMHRVLRSLEQRCSGDGRAPSGSVEGLLDRLAPLLAEHEGVEKIQLTRLSDKMTDEAAATLAERYAYAIGHGPTRPHLHGLHHGTLGGLTYAFEAARDRILDVLDSRPVPLPRPARPHRQVRRWGHHGLDRRGEPSEHSYGSASVSDRDQAMPRRRP